MVDNMSKIVDYAIVTKRFVGGLGILKRDGTIVKLNGQIFARDITKSGDQFILIDNLLGKRRPNQKKHWQMVLLDNLIALHENGWKHTKET